MADSHTHSHAGPDGPKAGPGKVHDHSHCEGHGTNLRGVKLTPGRQAILDMLCAAGQPLGAYDMIDRLAATGKKRAAPVTIYRALDYLVENGLVHRLASRNAFLACSHRHEAGEPLVFLICDRCGSVAEHSSTAIRDDLEKLAREAGFIRRTQIIEMAGVCAKCHSAS